MSSPDLRKTMIAIEISSPGDPEVLVPVERPIPVPAPGEVLVRVEAAGINRPDVMQRKGLYPPPPGASDIPGLEIAGSVVARGEGVSDLGDGTKVCALVSGGGYAQYCTAPAPLCLPIPDGLDIVDAAALPETLFTVWTNLVDRARLSSGESLLVHGGSSGIGTTAIQLAKLLGVRVFATAGSDRKCEACLELGASAAIDYRKEDFVERIKTLTEGRGVDVVLDMVAGDYLARNIECLAFDGRLVVIAVQRGPKVAEFNVLPIMLKRLTLTGSTLRPRTVEQKSEIARALQKNLWPHLESKAMRPIIHSRFPLQDAHKAHRLMESGEHIGKIMLTVESAIDGR
ncbi:NAD(P)H-quinone oxidoreductase [Thioalkalivibrio sp. HK1]|uniref:NAD(P)H-quinone oxidoreductase n=1 Tax=Thioalkalivibrio sp. HK1 TaxID=1469245 RepID=UPI0018CBF745|nr:NAD(P)H-quinone oxidoreductase [Thioalkalivibrio sp. HK1]